MNACPKCGKAVESEDMVFCPHCGEAMPSKPVSHVGQIIRGNFAVRELIGEGGMGKVYLGEQLSLKKPVAIKILKAEYGRGENFGRRFEREALAASRLQHPNSIQVIEFGRAESGELFLVMEYLQGEDLATTLAREFPFPVERTVEILKQVCSALDEAHAQSVVHRDLKPENIMLGKTRSGREFVKVLDFGLAQITAPSGGPAPERLTETGLICGTPEYMSPEQARGEDASPRSDLYALGVIMYQMLTGRLPFDSPNAIEIVTRHLQERPAPPRRVRPDLSISRELEAICLRALNKRPEDRQPDAMTFHDALEAVRSGQAVAPAAAQPAAPAPAATPGVNVSPAPADPGGGGVRVDSRMSAARNDLFDLGPTGDLAGGPAAAGGGDPAPLDLTGNAPAIGSAPEPGLAGGVEAGAASLPDFSDLQLGSAPPPPATPGMTAQGPAGPKVSGAPAPGGGAVEQPAPLGLEIERTGPPSHPEAVAPPAAPDPVAPAASLEVAREFRRPALDEGAEDRIDGPARSTAKPVRDFRRKRSAKPLIFVVLVLLGASGGAGYFFGPTKILGWLGVGVSQPKPRVKLPPTLAESKAERTRKVPLSRQLRGSRDRRRKGEPVGEKAGDAPAPRADPGATPPATGGAGDPPAAGGEPEAAGGERPAPAGGEPEASGGERPAPAGGAAAPPAAGDATAVPPRSGLPGGAAQPTARRRSFSKPLDDRHAERLYARASKRLAKGDYAGAANDLRKVIWVQEAYAPARRDIGTAFLQQGMVRAAAREFRNYLRLEPEAPDGPRIRELLAKTRQAGPGGGEDDEDEEEEEE